MKTGLGQFAFLVTVPLLAENLQNLISAIFAQASLFRLGEASNRRQGLKMKRRLGDTLSLGREAFISLGRAISPRRIYEFLVITILSFKFF